MEWKNWVIVNVIKTVFFYEDTPVKARAHFHPIFVGQAVVGCSTDLKVFHKVLHNGRLTIVLYLTLGWRVFFRNKHTSLFWLNISDEGEKKFWEHWVILIKLFWCRFTHSVLKATSFHKTEKMMVTLIKWSSLQKIVSKIMPKMFYEIEPCFYWLLSGHIEWKFNAKFNVSSSSKNIFFILGVDLWPVL